MPGMVTRERRRRLGLPEPLAPRAEPSRRRRKRRRRRGLGTSGRDWANLSSDLVRNIAGRLLSVGAAAYVGFRAVCERWREATDDPRARGALDIRFRPCGWMELDNRAPCAPRCRVRGVSGHLVEAELQALSANHVFAAADGLLVVRDNKAATTDGAGAGAAVRLLNLLTGALAEFPAITEVRAHDGAGGPDARLAAMDALRLRFSRPLGVRHLAGIDDSPSPPTLVFCFCFCSGNGSPWHVVCAKPGDQHWVCLHPGELTATAKRTIALLKRARCYQ